MPITTDEKVASIDRILVSLYALAEQSAGGGARQTSVDGVTITYRSHREVLNAIREYEQQRRWLVVPAQRIVVDGPLSSELDPNGARIDRR